MRRPTAFFLILLVGFTTFAAMSQAQEVTPVGFEKLKALVGDWEAELEGGDTVQTTYRLISNGTAVMESVNDTTHQDMTTIYHPDGEKLKATHYCSSDNQPRMLARQDGNVLAFSIVDVTNLTEPGQRHIRKIVFTFEDSEHYTQEWTQRENGEDTVDVLRFTRK